MAPLSPPGPSLDATTVAAVIALTKIIKVGRGGESLTIKIGPTEIEISSRGVEIASRGEIVLSSGATSIKLSGMAVDINNGALEVR
ncbi:hypothetical protein [Reyranella sp. CPCC 100927]|uniref:hypothetical protein n=1 Tax=Reyranella sp. CPCC 100927 TaxID=2599616 RepID=UPI0011B4FE18|nr:hypothetical protein [Reyranella sp. CPCC 100927]TWT00291.1 hypothetical protein FQU96_33745 [Reyranella sp. CPCC 100927]